MALSELLTAFVVLTATDDPYAAYRDGDYQRALELFLDAQVEHPKDERLALNVGNVYYRLGDFKNAERAFAQAAGSDDPAVRARALYNRGNAAFRMQDLAAAKKHYEGTLSLTPNDADAEKNLRLVERLLKEQQQQQRQQQDDKDDKNEEKDPSQQQQAQSSQGNESQKAQEQKNGGKEQQGQDQSGRDPQASAAQEQAGEPREQGAAAQAGGDKRGEAPEQGMQEPAPGSALSKEDAERYLLQLKEGRPRRGKAKGKARAAGGKDW